VRPQKFSGHLIEFPGGISPKNSVFEAIERQRVEGEEAVRSIARQKVLAKESGKRGRAAREKKEKKKKKWRKSRLAVEFQRWKATRGNSRRPPEGFWQDIVNGLWVLPERLRRKLTPRGKFLGKRQFLDDLSGRPRPDRG
jgi:hypothetical protein